MNIYVLEMIYDEESTEIYGTFSTREKAVKQGELILEDGHYYSYDIHMFTLDDEIDSKPLIKGVLDTDGIVRVSF